MKEFSSPALVRDDFQMSAEERLKYSLEQPQAQNALSMRATTAITKARISYALSQLAEMNVVNAHRWLQEIASSSPKMAFSLYLELLEFSAPKLKAVEHSVADPGAKPMSEYSLSELQAMAATAVVSTQ